MTSYFLTPSAWRDFFRAYDYIAANSQSAADRWQSRMLDAFSHVAQFPGSGTVRVEYAAEPLRFWVVDDYLILFDPRPAPVQVLALFHGAQQLTTRVASRLAE